jgi:hypothetical protein
MRKMTVAATIVVALIILTAAALTGCITIQQEDRIDRIEREQAERKVQEAEQQAREAQEDADKAVQADKDAQQYVDLGPCYQPNPSPEFWSGSSEGAWPHFVRWYGTAYNDNGEKVWLVSCGSNQTTRVYKPDLEIIIPNKYLALGSGDRSWGDPPTEYAGKIIIVFVYDTNGEHKDSINPGDEVFLAEWIPIEH